MSVEGDSFSTGTQNYFKDVNMEISFSFLFFPPAVVVIVM